MKTVIDAVNEFKGEFLFSIDYLLYDRLSGKYCAVNYLITPDGNGYQQLVCTKAQFLATVAECETNFGKCKQSYSDYKFDCHLSPEPILTYTQEMSDNGVLPIINNEIMYQYGITNYAKGTIKGVDGNQYWIKADCGGYVECNISKLKPVTPPITLEEQAILEACYIVNDSKRCIDTNINIDCSAAQKAVIITLIKNGYIKPLTVEVK
tara:strand:- start:94 stop:717 length:624 start_codon:yes stop_codon:yes gene_type:complete